MKKLLLLALLTSTNVHALQWECIDTIASICRVKRAPIPKGWLVDNGQGITFIQDKKHEWKIDK